MSLSCPKVAILRSGVTYKDALLENVPHGYVPTLPYEVSGHVTKAVPRPIKPENGKPPCIEDLWSTVPEEVQGLLKSLRDATCKVPFLPWAPSFMDDRETIDSIGPDDVRQACGRIPFPHWAMGVDPYGRPFFAIYINANKGTNNHGCGSTPRILTLFQRFPPIDAKCIGSTFNENEKKALNNCWRIFLSKPVDDSGDEETCSIVSGEIFRADDFDQYEVLRQAVGSAMAA